MTCANTRAWKEKAPLLSHAHPEQRAEASRRPRPPARPQELRDAIAAGKETYVPRCSAGQVRPDRRLDEGGRPAQEPPATAPPSQRPARRRPVRPSAGPRLGVAAKAGPAQRADQHRGGPPDTRPTCWPGGGHRCTAPRRGPAAAAPRGGPPPRQRSHQPHRSGPTPPAGDRSATTLPPRLGQRRGPRRMVALRVPRFVRRTRRHPVGAGGPGPPMSCALGRCGRVPRALAAAALSTLAAPGDLLPPRLSAPTTPQRGPALQPRHRPRRPPTPPRADPDPRRRKWRAARHHMATLAADALAVLDAYSLARTHVLGWGMAGSRAPRLRPSRPRARCVPARPRFPGHHRCVGCGPSWTTPATARASCVARGARAAAARRRSTPPCLEPGRARDGPRGRRGPSRAPIPPARGASSRPSSCGAGGRNPADPVHPHPRPARWPPP
jgi:hypothetical protein